MGGAAQGGSGNAVAGQVRAARARLMEAAEALRAMDSGARVAAVARAAAMVQARTGAGAVSVSDSGTGTDSGTGSVSGSGSDSDSDSGTGSGSGSGTDADSGSGAGTDSGADSVTDSVSGTGSDSVSGTDAGADSVSGTGTDAVSVSGAGTVSGTGAVSVVGGAVAATAARSHVDDRAALARSSGLSEANVAWGLSTTLGLFERGALQALAAQAAHDQDTMVTVVLAGNVLTACARPLLLPLACGVGVLVKASSRDDALPRLLQRALAGADPRLGAACEVLSFDREASDDSDALLEGDARLNVFGSDATIEAFTARAGAARVIAHGHGLGLAYVPREQAAADSAAALALDVAAYDQRGCLSPHAVYVQGDAGEAERFGARLHDALEERERTLPRGRVPDDAAAELVQWRGVAAAVGTLHASDTHAVSIEPRFRPTPGYRHVQVIACDDASAFRAHCEKLGSHLKAVGTTQPGALAGVAPFVCELGEMQRPGLGVRLDGMHALEGAGVRVRGVGGALG